MIECMIAAPASGSGKTVVCCALLAALRQRGKKTAAFKCGPDYIDPMFHRSVLEVPSRNLDLFLAGPQQIQADYARYAAGNDAVICEGVMGFYDGVGGTTTEAGSWALADALDLPVLLVLQPKGASLTLAALVNGLKDFVPHSHIAGIFLNNCKPMLYKVLAPMLEKNTGLPVLGYLPPMPEACFESRHLGLCTAEEIEDLQTRIAALGQMAQATVDWPALEQRFSRPDRLPKLQPVPSPRVRIAVARDEAFCFVYAQTLEAFRRNGAEPVFFSPMRDSCLPEGVSGLYLPGGYPELYAQTLSCNKALRGALYRAIRQGLPTVAECGGFLYLGQSLQDRDGNAWPMVGVLPGSGIRTQHLVRFGYLHLRAERDSLLFRRGEAVPAHEFHYWDSTENGTALEAAKPVTGRRWRCGFAERRLYAGFPHLYFSDALSARFVKAAEAYELEREG